MDHDSPNYILERYLEDLKTDAETVLDEFDGDPDYKRDSPQDSPARHSMPLLGNITESGARSGGQHGNRGFQRDERAPGHIIFTNSQGRQFTIPYEACKAWKVSHCFRRLH